MAERIDWLDDGSPGGSPFSPRFGDRYRSEQGGLAQARDVFLSGCGLPAAWAGQRQWRILETGFGLGLNFLVTWQAWRADPQRPRLLHFVSTEAYPACAADVLRSAAAHPELLPLAHTLCAQLWGLLPGFHRITLEGGQVLLTLGIGDAKTLLRQQQFEADSLYLDGFSPQKNPDIWDIHTFKAVARCCHRGTRLATWTIARTVRDTLVEAGFVVQKVPGVAPKRDNLQGEYQPSWQIKTPRQGLPRNSNPEPGTAVVIGAGLAGAAVAASLARRGWQVQVIDAAGEPASGASGLPAGVLAPHVSPDDSLMSQLSRSGLRLTLAQAEAWLHNPDDWALSGVLTRQISEPTDKRPRAWSHEPHLPGGFHGPHDPTGKTSFKDAAQPWATQATAEQLSACGLPISSPSLWHARAGWIKPASLVRAWLRTPGVNWRGHATAHQLTAHPDGWQVQDAGGQTLATARLVVIAAGFGSQMLAATVGQRLALQAIRGQVSWGFHATPGSRADSTFSGPTLLPPFPVNGFGSLIPRFPVQGAAAWLMGASFERDTTCSVLKVSDHAENLKKRQVLLPDWGQRLTSGDDTVQGWAGVRCATPTRLPLMDCLVRHAQAGELWVCTGLGSRGLTWAALCGELMAAQLHGEPLPIALRLAKALRRKP